MAAIDEEMSIIEASEDLDKSDAKNNNTVNNSNNFEENENSKESVKKSATEQENQNEKRKKFFHQYLYQQNYQEALRSLLWEPYDCRDDSNSWHYTCLNDSESGFISLEVPKRKTFYSSESSLYESESSSSSYSSLEENFNVEMTQKNALNAEKRNNLNIQVPHSVRKKTLSQPLRKAGKEFKALKTNETSSFLLESNDKEEKRFLGEFSESRCATDPVRDVMNIEIMVSDLHSQNGGGNSSYTDHSEAQKLHTNQMYASASQCKIGCESSSFCASDCEENDLSAANTMLLTVEGTLEPVDSNEGTQLVSSDTSLDLNDNPVRLTASSRVEPGPSEGNVSVVNCYRAVPVSVVSTVPTIKCLNTQNNVSNVNIIQTSNAEQKLSSAKRPPTQLQKFPPRTNGGPLPSTSRVRTKLPIKDADRNQSRLNTNLDQNTTCSMPKIEKERHRSTNICMGEINSEQLGQTPSALCENNPTSSNNGSSVLSNHNRSISNPVLGNQIELLPNRYGSQQNIPIRLKNHYGPNSSVHPVCSESNLSSRNVPNIVVSNPEPAAVNEQGVDNSAAKLSPRTFTSTEAQTDDVPLGIHPRSVINREQRRRERRERRHQRRLHQSVLNSGSVWQTNVDMVHRDRRGLPDILNSHMPPPYSAVSMPAMPVMPPPVHVHSPMAVPPGPQTVPHLIEAPPGQPLPHQGGLRFPFSFSGGGRRSQGQMFAHEEETPKSCCGIVVTQTVSIRWFIVMISFVGICCVIVGTVLGAMKASGREHLTVSLLMIGVGIVLVTVSVVAWRLTSHDAPSCRSMLGLGGADDSGNEPNQRFVPRMPPSYGRPHHPYAAMMYPEFQYRPPPPSYQASMQEYRLRLLLLERPNDTAAGLQAAMSPPPTYRSQAGSTLGLRAPALCRSLPQSEYSHPPSYRSRTSSTRPTLDPNGDTLGSVNHSRNSSLLSHVSDQNGNVSQAVVNVISVMGNTVDLHRGDTDLQIEGIKIGVDEEVPIPPLRMLLHKGKRSPTTSSEDTKSENVNLVTIVTVSDNNAAPIRDHSVESDVLAHL